MVMLAKWRDALWNDPLMTLAVTAALVALATTPIAFAVLGRMEWFKARRGRTMQRPDVLVDRRRDDAGHGHPGDLRRRWWSRASTSTRTATSSTPTRPGRCSSRGAASSDVKEADDGGQARDGAAGAGAEEPGRQRQEARRGDAGAAGRRGDVARRGAGGPERARSGWPRSAQQRRGRRAAAVDGLHRAAGRPGGRRGGDPGAGGRADARRAAPRRPRPRRPRPATA